MCGIAGLLRFDPEQAVDGRLLDRMTDVLRHRGPDGRGVFVDGAIGMGHRRLAIIDLSDDAAQPLANEDGSIQVTVNGEIYNFRELRRELEGRGHQFRSRSDSEVLAHLYEEHGDRMVERLRGMFAFALWDGRRRRLLLARDRFGQKPLYYRLTERSFHFGSEIKAILEDPSVPRVPNRRALAEYLSLGYLPGPETAFEGVRKLPAAHRLSVEADGRSRLERYWRLAWSPKRPEIAEARDLADAAAEVRERLDEATRIRMVADVPIGAFLSGGLDSSAVTAAMCAASGPSDPQVRTFSIGFGERAFDETAFAAMVAERLGTEHRRLEVTADALTDLERVAWHYGEPFADNSCLPTFALAKLAREHVTVALTGDGGDELFCGYRRYLTAHLAEWRRGGRGPLRALAATSLAERVLRLARRNTMAGELAFLRGHPDLPLADLYLRRLEIFHPELLEDLRGETLADATSALDPRAAIRDAIAAADGETFAERCAGADAVTYLPEDILVKVDVASMAHGLECRAPLLDHRLAEYVAALPFALKLRPPESKRVLREAVRDRLPRAVLERSKKGFGAPLESWLGAGFGEVARELLTSQRSVGRGYFRRDGLERLLSEHESGRARRPRQLFSLMMLEIWHRQWIDSAVAERPAGTAAGSVAASA